MGGFEEISSIESDFLTEGFDSFFETGIRQLVIDHILSFFKDREYESGGVIPRGELLRECNIDRVISFCNFSEGLTEIHKILSSNEPPGDFEHNELVEWEVKFLNELLNEAARAGVPKALASGIIILNLQYCYGMVKWRIWR